MKIRHVVLFIIIITSLEYTRNNRTFNVPNKLYAVKIVFLFIYTWVFSLK